MNKAGVIIFYLKVTELHWKMQNEHKVTKNDQTETPNNNKQTEQSVIVIFLLFYFLKPTLQSLTLQLIELIYMVFIHPPDLGVVVFGTAA